MGSKGVKLLVGMRLLYGIVRSEEVVAEEGSLRGSDF